MSAPQSDTLLNRGDDVRLGQDAAGAASALANAGVAPLLAARRECKRMVED